MFTVAFRFLLFILLPFLHILWTITWMMQFGAVLMSRYKIKVLHTCHPSQDCTQTRCLISHWKLKQDAVIYEFASDNRQVPFCSPPQSNPIRLKLSNMYCSFVFIDRLQRCMPCDLFKSLQSFSPTVLWCFVGIWMCTLNLTSSVNNEFGKGRFAAISQPVEGTNC